MSCSIAFSSLAMAAAAAPVLNPRSGDSEPPSKGLISILRSWWKRRGEPKTATTTDYGSLGDVVSFSSRRIAARRALETEQRPALFSDPLAFKLAGRALADARKSSLRNGKVDARVSRIAVRTKWFDEEVEKALRGERGTVGVEISVVPSSSSSEDTCSSAPSSSVRVSIRPRSLPRPWPSQVVCLGCGMDTRPWRLDFPLPPPSRSPTPTFPRPIPSKSEGKSHPTISWFDVDAGCVLRAKARELEEAGAEVPEGAFDLAFEEEEEEEGEGEGEGEGEEGRKQTEEERRRPKRKSKKKPKFPLKTSSYVAVPAAVSKPGALLRALASAGHDKNKPTVFVAEGLLMYLGDDGVRTCLSAAAEACPSSTSSGSSSSSSNSPSSSSSSPSSSTFLAVTITPSALKSAQERSQRRRAKGIDVAATDLLAAWNFGCSARELPALCGGTGWSAESPDSVVSRSDMARRYGPLVGDRGFEYEVADARVQEERGSLFFVARK